MTAVDCIDGLLYFDNVREALAVQLERKQEVGQAFLLFSF